MDMIGNLALNDKELNISVPQPVSCAKHITHNENDSIMEQEPVALDLRVRKNSEAAEAIQAFSAFNLSAKTLFLELVTPFRKSIKDGDLLVAENLYTKIKELQRYLKLDDKYGERVTPLNEGIKVVYMGIDYEMADLRYRTSYDIVIVD